MAESDKPASDTRMTPATGRPPAKYSPNSASVWVATGAPMAAHGFQSAIRAPTATPAVPATPRMSRMTLSAPSEKPESWVRNGVT